MCSPKVTYTVDLKAFNGLPIHLSSMLFQRLLSRFLACHEIMDLLISVPCSIFFSKLLRFLVLGRLGHGV